MFSGTIISSDRREKNSTPATLKNINQRKFSEDKTMSRQGTRVTDTKKVSGELFSLTYGALVAQILKDYQNVEDVNKQLEKMGYNIGVRIIEDFLAR